MPNRRQSSSILSSISLLSGLIAGGMLAALCSLSAAAAPQQKADPQVVVYGGTSGGVVAAIQAAAMGKSVVLIEPTEHLGGLSSSGLGATDIGNKAAIGGLAREFYRRVNRHYAQASAWVYEKPQDYNNSRQRTGEDTMWTFEPSVAEQIFDRWVTDAKVQVLRRERIDLKGGVELDGRRIVAVRLESGQVIRGKMFIDATYEGDLMAGAGVAYHVGREANSVYGETLNGVQTAQARHHQFIKEVDPYVVPGDASSGLLPGVSAEGPGEEGSGDHRVQAYCFRMCMTDAPENRMAWPKPEDYDPQRYELLLRNFEAGDHRIPYNAILMPNRKTDTNNNYAISTDHIGASYEWPEADHARRDEILEDHRRYQMGLMWTLANHPRVPEVVRGEVSRWGLCRDEFVSNGGWPYQLYVREARRMKSDYVMTQHNCQGREVAADLVGMAAYTMDSHHVQRYVVDGHARNEGDVQVGRFPPYPISYRSIVPGADQCENLLVPVCLSASHIAYGSIRMEPVFMVLGQSAATAAALAIDNGTSVQQVDYAQLRARLLADGQVLELALPGP